MKTIELTKLDIENFKGIKKLSVNFAKNTGIHGQNESGKTTVMDAFTWCLFGKDSLNKSDFEIKTLRTKTDDANVLVEAGVGSVIHNLDHSVSAFLKVDGKVVVFKKVFKEKWTKKRGQTTKDLTGHTTDHFVDEVPSSKKEYDKNISELIDEKLFRLLTDARYFNEVMHWEDRRNILFELAGDIKDDAIAGFNLVKSILDGKTVDDMKKVIASKRKQINKTISEIPARIDELTKQISEPEYSKSELQKQIADIEQSVRNVKGKISIATFDDGEESRKQKIQEIESMMSQVKSDFAKAKNENLQAISEQASPIQKQKTDLELEIHQIETLLNKDETDIVQMNQEVSEQEQVVESIRLQWSDLANAPDASVETVCPTCQQHLPEHTVKETVERINVEKSNQLEGLANKAKAKKETVKALKEQIENRELSLPNWKKQLDEKRLLMPELETQVEALNHQYGEIQKEVVNVYVHEEKIAELQKSKPVVDTSELEGEISSMNIGIEEKQSALLDIKKNADYAVRIDELTADQKRLGQEYADLENQLDQLEAFTISKVNFIEEKINGLFKLSRFKLFHTQINGGIDDVCETMNKGVPYNSVNNAGKIQLGVDIINTLQAFYLFKAPIWIDNRESITEIPEVDCQVVSLFVSPDDKVLRVE